MSAFPPPTNGYFNGATYNSAYFTDSNSNAVTKEYLQENYLPRVGNPTDVAESTYFQGEIIEGQNILLVGTQGDQYIQWPNGSQQKTAFLGLPEGEYTYATITTDADGAISSVAQGTGEFPMDIVLTGTQGTQYIQYPNGSQQFTAMNTLPANQTYNLATVKTDANGAISSITSNTIPTTTIPVKVASAYGTYSGSYISFTINTNGSTSGAWLQNQFFTIRYTISLDFNPSSSSPNQYQSYASAIGTMDIYPYRFATNWCSNSNAPAYGQLPNSINGNSNYNMVDSGTTSNGSAIAPSGRQFWSYPSATISNTNSFYIQGTKSSLVFQLVNPYGWSSDINNFLQTQMILNKQYLVNSAGEYVYFITLQYDTNYYAVQLECFAVPDQLPSGYSNPANMAFPAAGAPATPTVTIFSTNNFGELIGFDAATYPATSQTSNQSFTSNMVPDGSPVNALIMRCNLIDNNVVMPSDIMDSIPISNVTFGTNLAYEPSFPKWVKMKAGKYSSMTVQLVDQNLNAIVAKDPNVCITLLLMLGNSTVAPYTKR
eukprot:gene11551-12932_t